MYIYIHTYMYIHMFKLCFQHTYSKLLNLFFSFLEFVNHHPWRFTTLVWD